MGRLITRRRALLTAAAPLFMPRIARAQFMPLGLRSGTPSIAFKNAASLGNGTGTTFTASYSVNAASNLLIVVMATGAGLSGVTYNGVAMTVLPQEFTGYTLSMCYLVNPATGAHNVVATFGSSVTAYVGAADYSGAATSGQPDNDTTNIGTSTTSLTTSLTPVLNNCWAMLVGGGAVVGTQTAGAGATLRAQEPSFGLWGFYDSNGPVAGGSPHSMTFDIGSTNTLGSVMASFAP